MTCLFRLSKVSIYISLFTLFYNNLFMEFVDYLSNYLSICLSIYLFIFICSLSNYSNYSIYLSIYLHSVGSDSAASAWLKELDDTLVTKAGAVFDIVDTLSSAELKQMSFADIVKKSISD